MVIKLQLLMMVLKSAKSLIEGEWADKKEITAIAHLGLADHFSTAHVMIAIFQTEPELPGGSEFALATAWAKYIGPGVVTVNLHYVWPIGLPMGGWGNTEFTYELRAYSDSGIINVNGEQNARYGGGRLKSQLFVEQVIHEDNVP